MKKNKFINELEKLKVWHTEDKHSNEVWISTDSFSFDDPVMVKHIFNFAFVNDIKVTISPNYVVFEC